MPRFILLISLSLIPLSTHALDFPDSDKRVGAFVKAMLWANAYYQPYSAYIGTNGLFTDATFQWLENALSTNRAFMKKISQTPGFAVPGTFFSDFKSITRAFACSTFEKGLGGKKPESYEKELDALIGQLQAKAAKKGLTEAQKATYNEKIAPLGLLKKRIAEFRAVKPSVPEELKKAVDKKEAELSEIFSRMLTGN